MFSQHLLCLLLVLESLLTKILTYLDQNSYSQLWMFWLTDGHGINDCLFFDFHFIYKQDPAFMTLTKGDGNLQQKFKLFLRCLQIDPSNKHRSCIEMIRKIFVWTVIVCDGSLCQGELIADTPQHKLSIGKNILNLNVMSIIKVLMKQLLFKIFWFVTQKLHAQPINRSSF